MSVSESSRTPRLSDNAKRVWAATCAVVALIALLAAGALALRDAFLTRGMPSTLPGPITGGGVELGINASLDLSHADSVRDTLEAIANAGFGRIKHPFYYTPKTPTDWNAIDRLFDAARASGVQIVPLLDGDPATQFAPPDDPATFAAWAGEFAGRYGESVDAYIIWDEPNLASHWGGRNANPDAYAALLSAAAAAVRAADSSALIVAAPLAPTTETAGANLSDARYLQQMYEAGAADAFDIAAGKPYGFDSAPTDRRVDEAVLNFSRAVLLREVMLRNGDSNSALWAGNWGWNALPTDWQGPSSIWGAVDANTQQTWTVDALERARREWPWMGVMFLENWEPPPGAEPNDPRWGFSVANRPIVDTLQAARPDPAVAGPGFHLASAHDSAQTWQGEWRFSAEFGADSSEKTGDQPRDRVTFRFDGTDLGLRVRRADYRARFYVTVDGQPANQLPRDENGAALVLDAPDPADDYISIEPVASGLPPGEHIAVISAERGWGQWALNGFSVADWPPDPLTEIGIPLLGGVAVAGAVVAVAIAARTPWGEPFAQWRTRFRARSDRVQLALVGLLAAVVAATGWLTWGQQAAGAYRRLGDGAQLGAVVATGVLFYVTPAFAAYAVALLLLIVLLSFRPAWGLALVALSIPFYATDLLKPMFSYRFSPVELFTWATLAGFLLNRVTLLAQRGRDGEIRAYRLRARRWVSADGAVVALTVVATLSLLFTERLDPALREWRTVVLNAALLYALLRWIKPDPRELWAILDAWVVGAVLVALIGLGEYAIGIDRIAAEGGLFRLRSIYGSPNNVALYFGRIMPLLIAVVWLGRQLNQTRRRLYATALLPIGAAMILTFSKGGLLLALPVGVIVIFIIWQRERGQRVLPWLLLFGVAGGVALFILLRVPPLAARLDLFGETTVQRLNLWRASLNMVADHVWTGVGLDNFLTEYRGRYILAEAWREPNLNHPHNIVLDFATRLGVFGLATGAWLFIALGSTLYRATKTATPAWKPVAAGLLAGFAAAVAHGLVDHSFFLIDLAAVFCLMLGIAVWLADQRYMSPDGADSNAAEQIGIPNSQGR